MLFKKNKKVEKKYFLLDEKGAYLVKGSLNGKEFDGKGKPFAFSESQAMLMGMFFGYDIEEVDSDKNNIS